MADPLDPNGGVFVITGGNSGIGLAAARVLAERGGKVVLACRSAARGQAAADAIADRARERPECMVLDLASLAGIRAFAEAFCARFSRLDALINNAGVMALPRTTTRDGFETQFGVNHLGHFALTGLLLRVLRDSPAPRVVTVSSMAHWLGRMHWDDLQGERRYGRWTAYNQSKLANLLFAFELQRRCAATMPALTSVACHPGYAATNLQLVAPQMERARFRVALFQLGNALLARSPEAGAEPTVVAATAAVTGGTMVGPALGYWRSPRVQRSSLASRNPAHARRLWELSVELTGVDPGL